MSESDKLPRLVPFEKLDLAEYKICEVCGQRFDPKDQKHVLHHGPEPHLPL